MGCKFCEVVARQSPAEIVFEDGEVLAFLDVRPLFPGHVLLVPKRHIETLNALPPDLIGPLFSGARLLAGAVEAAMGAQGSFIAINNRVSQSVPHLHVHIVPRRPKDGLKGFFWPRSAYHSDEELRATAASIRAAIPAH